MVFYRLRLSKTSTLILALLAMGLFLGPYGPIVPRAHAVPNAPVVGVWSNACQSFNITVSNAACGSLSIGTTISVQINVTNVVANEFEGYELFLFYDPTFLSATSADTTSSPTVFPNPLIVLQNFATAGTVHLVGACLACNDTGPGTIVNINFKILGTGVSPLTLAAGLRPSVSSQSFTVLGSHTSQGAVFLVPSTADGYFKNEPTKLGPVASFTFAPASATLHQQINFTATGSFDPDNINAPNHGISQYRWDFGAGYSAATASPFFNYAPSQFGNFSVRLTVIDSDNNFEGMKAKPFAVSLNPAHDLIAQNIFATPNPAHVGDKVSVSGLVLNNGTSPENFNLVVSYSSPPITIGTATNQYIPAIASYHFYFNFTFDTSHLTPGVYALMANVTVLPSASNPSGVDNIPTNNVVTSFLNLLPPLSPDFAILANPSLLMIQAGRNGTSTITLNSIAGFSGSVTLSARVFPVVGTIGPATTLQPSSLQVSAGGPASSNLIISTLKSTPQSFYNVIVNGTSGALSHSVSIGVEIVAPPDLPPVANFTFFPASPVTGQFVSFDGSSSFDPDGRVVDWSWNFGDGSFFGFGPFTSHAYSATGSYTVTLTVRDNAGLSASKSVTLQVRQRPLHDVSIAQVQVQPNVAVSTQFVFINIEISNDGLNNETVSLTAYYDSHPIQTLTSIFVPLQSCNQFFCQSGTYVTITWDTTGIAAGNYTISATVSIAPGELDPTPSDNSFTGSKITILPPPVLTLTPISGSVGTKVLVQGSGFLAPQFFFSSPFVDVTFDDQFVGFTFANNGKFNFTFDIPDAEPGPHLVKAMGFDGVHASTAFQVLPAAGGLSVSVNTGVVYFPGDTVTIYVLATLNGAPLSTSGFQLQVGIFLPNGTKVTLSAIPVTPGLFKATYKIPKTGPLGTYAVVATGHASGAPDTSALGSFEVKLSWLSSQGQNIIGATTLAGIVGLVAVAWRKGYLRRKDEN